MLGKTRAGGEKSDSEDELVGWHHRLNGHELEQTLRDSEGQASLAGCSLWGHKELDTIEGLKNNNSKASTPCALILLGLQLDACDGFSNRQCLSISCDPDAQAAKATALCPPSRSPILCLQDLVFGQRLKRTPVQTPPHVPSSLTASSPHSSSLSGPELCSVFAPPSITPGPGLHCPRTRSNGKYPQ